MSMKAAYIVPHPPLIIPEVGRGQEEKIRDTIDAYQKIAREIGDVAPDTVVLVSPHATLYQDYIHISPGTGAVGDFRRFGAKSTALAADYDQELVSKLEELAGRYGIPAGTLGEVDKGLDHGTMVPLFFIQQELREFQVVRVGISGLSSLDHYRFGICLKEAVEALNRKVVLIASGDLSHRLKDLGPYDFAEEGPVFDQRITEGMAKADFLDFLQMEEGFCEAAGECGHRSFLIMAGALDGTAVVPSLLSYEGPFGVGYAVASFHVTGVDETRHFDLKYQEEQNLALLRIKEEEDPYVRLARASLESYVADRKTIERPKNLPEDLMCRRSGVFVSLKKDGRLRGCIGTIEPVTETIADEILRNAISAGVGDPRFDPVGPDELNQLVYSVDVLGAPEPISSLDELDVIRYGVIVAKGRKKGLLLPNLDGVTSPEQQVSIALKKAGIPSDSDYQMERFEVVRHK